MSYSPLNVLYHLVPGLDGKYLRTRVTHEKQFEKTIDRRIKDEVSGHYKKIQIGLLDKACPEFSQN